MKVYETTTRRFRNLANATYEAILTNLTWLNTTSVTRSVYGTIYRERRDAIKAEADRRGLTPRKP